MVKRFLKRIASVWVSGFLIFLGSLSPFLPFPRSASAASETYAVRWDNNDVTEESYAELYSHYFGITENTICVYRRGMYGMIPTTERFEFVYDTLRTGGLAQLLSLSGEGISRLERLALWREFQGCVFYSAGFFVWNGQKLVEEEGATGDRVVLLSGSISSSRLQKTGAKSLELRAEAEIDSKTLIGTEIESITACAPYSVSEGAVYLDTGTAVRLIAAVPAVRELSVSGNGYADKGALLAAQNLQSLTLPFAGNAPEYSHYFKGELAELFSDGKNYSVPASLKKVKITGGLLVSHAFYRCHGVEEIDLCGMNASRIDRDALIDCTGWKRVHAPTARVNLCGTFQTYLADCGCTVFERI